MKSLFMVALFVLSSTAQASITYKVSCQGQWKNTSAAPMSFYILVKGLYTAKPQVLFKTPVDDWKQRVFGLKKLAKDHIANESFYEMAMGDPVKGWPGASEGYAGLTQDGQNLMVNLDDGVSSNIDIVLYKNSKFQRGSIKQHCDPSYCGDFDYYAVLNCTVHGLAGGI